MTNTQLCLELADTLERIGASGASVDALRRRCNVYRGDVTFDESDDWCGAAAEQVQAARLANRGISKQDGRRAIEVLISRSEYINEIDGSLLRPPTHLTRLFFCVALEMIATEKRP